MTQYNNEMVKIRLEHPQILSNEALRSKTNIDIGMSSDNADQIKEKAFDPSSRRDRDDIQYQPS